MTRRVALEGEERRVAEAETAAENMFVPHEKSINLHARLLHLGRRHALAFRGLLWRERGVKVVNSEAARAMRTEPRAL